jgi:hypothetical protein
VTGLEDKQYSLRIEHRDYSAAMTSLAAGVLDTTIVLKGRGRIEGLVLRADSGEPLPDYTLHRTTGRIQGWGGLAMGAGQLVESGDGTLSVPKVPVGETSIAVQVPGYAPQWRVVTVEEDSAATVEFRLESVAAFEGSVVTRQGEPASNAYIYYSEGPMLDYIDRTAVARTDEAGTFVLDSLPKDVNRLFAYGEGHGIGVAKIPGEGRIVLPEPGTVEGEVLVTDVPFNDINVNYRYPDDRHIPNGYMRLDSNGTFRLTGMTPGNLQVRVEPNTGANRHGIEYEVVVEEARTAKLQCAFEGGRAVFERVLRADGDPVAKAWLRLEKRQENATEYLRGQPGSNGKFRFEGAWAGDLVLTVTRADPNDPHGIIREELDVTLQEGQMLWQDIGLEPVL